ncbi:phosphoadenosine phosphosulfate reductase family protein [Shewanella oncorhynchi]|uniref:phosphoadenosine phosphosulfate reductase domain-containing protein n=1 Tax=Shewanella oncorhynchi TaxID=2726434 RepID=UPI003D7AE604
MVFNGEAAAENKSVPDESTKVREEHCVSNDTATKKCLNNVPELELTKSEQNTASDCVVLVPVSGGKDSQACLKMAIAEFGAVNVRGLFCDTKFEHPLTYQHIDYMREKYGVRIDVVCGGTVLDKTMKYKRFPGGGARHCTDELKIRETRIYLKEQAKKQGGFQVWYGMRHDESAARAKRYAYKDPDDLYPPHEVLNKYPKYLAKMGVQFRLPIIDWTDVEVMQFLEGEHNPLYDSGFKRVGCFPCLASGDKWKLKAFSHDEFGKNQRIAVKEIEGEIGKSIWTSNIGINAENDSQGCVICQI